MNHRPPEALKWDEVWVGQLVKQHDNPKRYRVVAIINNPDRVRVRVLGGINLRTVSRESLEIAWFPAGAVPTKDRQEEE